MRLPPVSKKGPMGSSYMYHPRGAPQDQPTARLLPLIPAESVWYLKMVPRNQYGEPVRAEASGWGVGSSVGSRFECGRTWSDGAWPRERWVGSPRRGRGTQHLSRATLRNHATQVSTEPVRSTPSRIAPALTRDRCGIVCCAPLYVTRLMSYVHAACSMRQPPPSPSAPARRVHPGNPHAPTSPKERRECV